MLCTWFPWTPRALTLAEVKRRRGPTARSDLSALAHRPKTSKALSGGASARHESHSDCVQSCVKTFLPSFENQNVPLPTPNMHYGALFQPAIPKTWQDSLHFSVCSASAVRGATTPTMMMMKVKLWTLSGKLIAVKISLNNELYPTVWHTGWLAGWPK